MRRTIEDQPVEYPTAKDVFQVALREMLATGAGTWCHFDDVDSSVWAEVAPNGQGLHIKLSCPRPDRLEDVLVAQILSGSDHWRVVEFRRKSLLSQGRITFLAPPEDLEGITSFMDNFFVNTCPKGRSYCVLGSVQS
jgi:hypothetical protein